MDILVQALGLVGMVLILASFQFREQKALIRIQLVSSLVFAIHYLLLGATTGAVLNIIGIGRAYVFSSKERPWARKKGWVPLFCGAYALVYILTFTLLGRSPVPRDLVLELLPVIGSVVTTIGFYLDNITMRKLALVNGTAWLVYNVISGSVGGTLTEAFGIGSVLIGLWRLKNRSGISPLFRVIKWLVALCYPQMEVVGTENLPDEPAIIVGNHSQMHGPIACELYFPGKHYTWCAGEMMHLKDVPAYAYQDFWSQKPKYSRWFYKALSYLIAPLSVCVFNNANTIGVYRDARIISTFKNTVKRLCEGANVVVFPEHPVPHDHILCEFQDKFIDTARLYYKKTGRELCFVPLYIAPSLRTMYLGTPIRFCASNSMDCERRRICDHLMAQITAMACALPAHTVVPYQNIPKKDYPSSIPKEAPYEKTRG